MKPCSKCGKWQCECETVDSPAQVPTLSAEGTNTPPASTVEVIRAALDGVGSGGMMGDVPFVVMSNDEFDDWRKKSTPPPSGGLTIVEEIVAREAFEVGVEAALMADPTNFDIDKHYTAYLSTHSGETQGKEKI